MNVAYFGTWERGYPRNDQVISALRRAGVDVRLLHEELWTGAHKFATTARVLPRLVAAETKLALRRVPADVDALVVGYPGQFDVWAAKRHGKPVIFNAMVSLFDTLVEDRHRFAPGSIPARGLRAIDRAAIRAADSVVADTAANAKYLAELAGIDKVEVCFVGAEDRLFRPAWRRPDEFRVLFIGKLIPLHGVDVILEAARALPGIPFRIIGSGQLDELLREPPLNVEHVPWLDYSLLPDEYANAGCALGVFGSSEKAQRVIPNKAFQALAVGTPLITASTPGAAELLRDGQDALLVEPTAEALVRAIRRLADDPSLAERIGQEGRRTYEREASERVLGESWRAVIESAIGERGR
jgi:glycosyltransferase involved in cell wall biosynthesis